MHDQAASGRKFQQPREARIVERVAVVIWMQPDARHVKRLVAAADVSSQSGSVGLTVPNGISIAVAVLRTGFCEPLVHAGDVFVKQAVEAADPGLA